MAGGFTPGPTQTVFVGDSPVEVVVRADEPMLQLLNIGAEMVFVKLGTGDVEASRNDYPVMPHVPVMLNKGVGADRVSLIGSASQPSYVYVTTGTGS